MQTRLFATTVLLLVACHLATGADSETPRAGELYFGWASTSITPDRPVAIAGQYDTRISGEVHDPLLATALAIETRDDTGVIDHAVWVSCDLTVIRRKAQEKVRQLVRQRLPELDVQKIIISATHTHTAPALTDAEETNLHPYDFLGSWAYRIPSAREDVMRPAEYLDFLAERLSAVVIEAWQSREPGAMSSALGRAVVARNRRAVYLDGTTHMYGNTSDPKFSHIEGVSDHSVDMLFFWHGEGQLVGIALTVYCPAQEVEGQSYLSADFWYDTRKMLREKHHAGLWVLPLIGASGDQSPHLMWNKRAELAQRNRRGLSPRQEIARRIVDAVDAVLEDARANIRTHVEFEHRAKLVPLPVWQVSTDRYSQARTVFEAGENKTDQLSSPDYINWRVSRTLMARYVHQQEHPNYPAELHLLRLGDVAITTNPFELYTDYGVRLKARSPAIQTWVVQLTSGCAAYLPTRRAVQGGGYSARIVDGVVGPDGGDVLVDETVRSLDEMWPHDRAALP